MNVEWNRTTRQPPSIPLPTTLCQLCLLHHTEEGVSEEASAEAGLKCRVSFSTASEFAASGMDMTGGKLKLRVV